MESDMKEIQARINELWDKQQARKSLVNRSTPEERILKLKRMLHWIQDNRSRIHEAVSGDFKKPLEEVDLTEIWMNTTELKFAIRNLKKWLRPKPVRRTLATISTKSWIQYEPKGVVLIIAPWNYPLNLSIGPLVSAIAAGNCVIIKPSEFTPNASGILNEMVTELFPEDEVAVAEGDYRVAEALQEKPFNHVFFTGSPAVGKKVMNAASKHLSSITLELGGKSPTIVDKSARIEDSAKKIVYGKFLNCGQTCIAPDYILVHEEVHDNLVAALKNEVVRVFGQSAKERESSASYARLVHERHFDGIKRTLDDTIDQGGHIEIGGESTKGSLWFSPTVITGVSPKSPIMKNEIFGPLLPVIKYGSLDTAISIIESIPKPLALYIFSQDEGVICRLLAETSAGGTCINDTVLHFLQMNLPFGGVNNSGIGKAHGWFGFEAFSNRRAVLRQSRFSPIMFITPPYNTFKRKLIRLVLKYF